LSSLVWELWIGNVSFGIVSLGILVLGFGTLALEH